MAEPEKMLLLNARLDGVGEPGSTTRCGLGDGVNIHTFSYLSIGKAKNHVIRTWTASDYFVNW